MAYELSGRIKLIQEPVTFDSGFTKREVIVTVNDGKYPQDICLEFVKDKVSLLDEVAIGQDATVTFDIRGREYNGRYFNNLQGWKIQSPESTCSNPENDQNVSVAIGSTIDDIDVPF